MIFNTILRPFIKHFPLHFIFHFTIMHIMRLILSTALLLILNTVLPASPAHITRFIRLDQFGYFCTDTKLAVVADPRAGFDAGDAFSPGTGVNQYEVRKWSSDEAVYTGTITSWNGGTTHTQSGDKGWYFDFSALTAPGTYYIFDVTNQVGSYQFEISEDIFGAVLFHTSRFYYYQRCNFAKSVPFADSRWTDAAAFEGPRQDKHARSRYAKNDPSTERDVSAGWFDAGDYNKYVTFAIQPVLVLLDAYLKYPGIFKDANNIPESGNGIPDILDELKYELDWLKKMQDATSTNGFLIKVGVDTYDNTGSPPSSDQNNRYWVPECTSSTIGGAAMFAAASLQLKSFPSLASYADDLKLRAENAFSRAMVTTSNFTTFQTTCDDQNIKSGDADQDAASQLANAVVASIYLYEANIGNNNANTYKTFVESHYTQINPMANYWWGPYDVHVENALLHYTTLTGVSSSVSNAIRSSKINSNTGMSIGAFNNRTDLYLSFMYDDQYHWGSAQVKASLGMSAQNFKYYNLDVSNNESYKKTAQYYLHWFHGLNPLGVVMISNMYESKADSCINEVYHSWFADGTIFDNTKLSQVGPAPGFIPGGPNKNYSVSQISPPYAQPSQKSYKDWNTAWNGSFQEASYEVSEVSIYVQACYLSLLAGILADAPDPGTCDLPLAVQVSKFTLSTYNNNVRLDWSLYEGNYIDIERSGDGQNFRTIAQEKADIVFYVDHDLQAGTYYYRLKVIQSDGNYFYSKIQQTRIENSFQFSQLKFNFDNNQNVLLLENAGSIQIHLNYTLITAQGECIRRNQITIAPREIHRISMQEFPPGKYFFTYLDGNKVMTKSFMKIN